MKQISKLFAVLGLMASSHMAFAHAGHGVAFAHSHVGAWLTGFVHPFTGLDHLVLALGLGLLMVKTYKRLSMPVLLALLGFLAVGFAVGQTGLAHVSAHANLTADTLAEWGIRLSVVAVAIALWRKNSKALGLAAVALAFCHGYAHGVELPAASATNSALIALGMLCSMLLLAIDASKGAQWVLGKSSQRQQQLAYKAAAGLSLLGLV